MVHLGQGKELFSNKASFQFAKGAERRRIKYPNCSSDIENYKSGNVFLTFCQICSCAHISTEKHCSISDNLPIFALPDDSVVKIQGEPAGHTTCKFQYHMQMLLLVPMVQILVISDVLVVQVLQYRSQGGAPGEMTVEIEGSASQCQATQQLVQNSIADAASSMQSSAGGLQASQGYNNKYSPPQGTATYASPQFNASGQAGHAHGSNYGY